MLSRPFFLIQNLPYFHPQEVIEMKKFAGKPILLTFSQEEKRVKSVITAEEECYHTYQVDWCEDWACLLCHEVASGEPFVPQVEHFWADEQPIRTPYWSAPEAEIDATEH